MRSDVILTLLAASGCASYQAPPAAYRAARWSPAAMALTSRDARPTTLRLKTKQAKAFQQVALHKNAEPVMGPASARQAASAAAMRAKGLRDVASSKNRAYERARQAANQAAHAERLALEEWDAAKERGTMAATLPTDLASGGVSSVLGFCSGKACRVFGDAAAFGLGASFVFAALLSRAGYVNINYNKVERDLLSLLDLNKGALAQRSNPYTAPRTTLTSLCVRPLSRHADGRIDQADYTLAVKRAVSLLADRGISSTAGFATGFVLGFVYE